jgi:hypothetical protein
MEEKKKRGRQKGVKYPTGYKKKTEEVKKEDVKEE